MPQRWPPELVLEAIRAKSQTVLHSFFRPDCCIAATRIGIEVCKLFGIHGQPRAVTTVAGCKSFADWLKTPEIPPPPDAYYVITDIHDRSGGFPGHLVITGKVSGNSFMLDLSAAQMHRPMKNILVPEPLTIQMPDVWPEGQAIKVPLEADGILIYSHHPRPDISWHDSPDWTLVKPNTKTTFNAVVAQIASEVRQELNS